MTMPVIDVFAITYNEEFLLPYFLRHYAFARRITILDNESTDRTVEIAKQNPKVTVETWRTGGLQDNLVMRSIKNNCWRGSTADYVVVCDIDEFVDCSPLATYGVHEVAFECMGRQMVGLDGQALESITRYDPNPRQYDKIAVFSPRIDGINYGCGAHVAEPSCEVMPSLLILRHYMLLGEEYLLARYRKYSARMSRSDLDNRWGAQYLDSEEQIRGHWRNGWKESVDE